MIGGMQPHRRLISYGSHRRTSCSYSQARILVFSARIAFTSDWTDFNSVWTGFSSSWMDCAMNCAKINRSGQYWFFGSVTVKHTERSISRRNIRRNNNFFRTFLFWIDAWALFFLLGRSCDRSFGSHGIWGVRRTINGIRVLFQFGCVFNHIIVVVLWTLLLGLRVNDFYIWLFVIAVFMERI